MKYVQNFKSITTEKRGDEKASIPNAMDDTKTNKPCSRFPLHYHQSSHTTAQNTQVKTSRLQRQSGTR